MALSPRRRRCLTVLLALAAALPSVSPATAQDRTAHASAVRQRWIGLGRLLEEVRTGSPAVAPRLQQALDDLQAEAARWRRQQIDIARRDLPAKARERQAKADAAHAAGQGRLLQILRALAAPRPGEGSAGALADEGLALVARLESASRREAISAAEPRVFAPVMHPPALRAPVPAPLAEAPTEPPAPPDGAVVAAALREQAALLDGPAAVYDWVRNEIRPDFYYGAMRGPLQAFLERRGNDADTAAVLIELMRAKGIPARYVRGTVEVPAGVLTALTGTAAAEQAVRVLERAGIPHQVVPGGGGVAAVRLERVWAEAYVPYANYRGALLDAQGKVWVPLDPAFKPLQPLRGLDVRQELGFAPRDAFDEYLSEARADTPMASVRASVTALLAAQRPGVAYDDVLNRRVHVQETLGLLPSSLPYLVRARADVGVDLPPDLVHTVRLVGEGSNGALFTLEKPLPDLAGHRVTLAYEPFSDDDRDVVARYGGMTHTPPYLFDVRPILKIDGVPAAGGDAGIGMAVAYTLRLEMDAPAATLQVSNRVLAGNLTAIGLAGRAAAGAGPGETAAQILDGLTRSYFQRWDDADAELADLLRVAPVRPTLPACLAASDVEVDYAGGDPELPVTFDWKGALIDADLRASAPVALARDQAAAERDFLLLSGLEGSVLEDRVFAEGLHVPAVSTASALGLAAARGVTVHTLTAANASEVVPGLPLDPAVKAEVMEATARGLTVRLPAETITQSAWTGVGYLILDEETGASAWQLQGGHSGGVTVPSVLEWPEALLDPLLAQGEETPPAPPGSRVATLVKFGSTDFQIGVVATMLPKAFKVLVTDEAGRPVEGAQVTFRVLGGGGLLVEPVTDEEKDVLTVVADAHGEASAPFLLGKKTDPIPRYLLFEGDEFSTQTGMNVVTATAGGLTLQEPFFSFALPDDQFDGENRHATITNHTPDFHCAMLSACSPLQFDVKDQHGNPLSNIPVTLAYKPSPTQFPLEGDYAWMRPPTQTPLHLLTVTDLNRCVEARGVVTWGQCEGEAEVLTLHSSPAGIAVYGVMGDSMGSAYRVEGGTPAQPDAIKEKFSTWGLVCRSVNGACTHGDLPLFVVVYDERRQRTNALGNIVEAYAVGGEADASFTATNLYEEWRVVREAPGLFRAEGTNVWHREPLTDSLYTVTPATPGTGVGPSPVHVHNGYYSTTMTMGLTPQVNTVHAVGKHFPLQLKYLAYDEQHHLDPAYVTDGNPPVAERIKIQSRPEVIEQDFSLWGIAPDLTAFTPTPVLVSSDALVTRESAVSHQVLPAEYAELLDPREVVFEVKRAAPDGTQTSVLVAANTQPGGFRIPVGMPAPPGTYTGTLTVANVNFTTEARVESPARQVPICGVVTLKTPIVEFGLIRDPDNDVTCGHEQRMVFDVCWDATVTIRVAGAVLEASVDGGPEAPIENMTLAAGTHEVTLGQNLLGLGLSTQTPFSVEATTLMDPTLHDRAEGVLSNQLANRSVAPVGHTFVKGVDLLDGHVVRSSVDFTVPGRHLNLEVSRTYSSAGSGADGAMGAGWSWTYAAGLYIADCGLATVVTPAGDSQTFRTSDGGITYAPQKGYHSRLVRNDDLSFDFFDKADRRHHFREPEDPAEPLGSRRLEYIEEPHGDRIVLHHDAQGRVVDVAEVQPEFGEVRSLHVTYEPRGGFDRIKKIEIPALRLKVEYTHDAFGNLTAAVRTGDNVVFDDSPARTELYGYSITNGVDRHQLLQSTGPNGEKVEYRYLAATDTFLGEQAGRLFQPKTEYAKEVREFASVGRTMRTQFEWDYRDAAQLRYKNTVRDGRGNPTLYVMDGRGSPHEIRDAAGKSTYAEWADDDVLKTKETDANGRVTRYEHDQRGNLTDEIIETSDMGEVRSHYAYGPCNTLETKTDAEGQTTSWVIDDRCDVQSHTDAAGNTTTYVYDADGHGLLQSERSPRGFETAYLFHDSFGHPLVARGPTGISTRRDYDQRGRLLGTHDDLGHETTTEYDGFDRPTLVRNASNADGSDDDVTYTSYYPGGQVFSTYNANGLYTEHTLDGLNRVTATDFFLGEGQQYTTSTTYDAAGNPEFQTDRRAVTRHNVFDVVNRLRSTEILSGPGGGPLGEVATFDYDPVGNKRSETNVAGLTTRFFYDGLYHLRRQESPEPRPDGNGHYAAVTVYDRAGRLVTQTDFNGHSTVTSYDGIGRTTSITDGAGRQTTMAYDDPEGSHVNKSEERDVTHGLRTTFVYDPLNREIERTVHLDGPQGDGQAYSTATQWEDSNHAVTVTDARGVDTHRRLDGLDRVVEETVDVGPDRLNLTTRTDWDGLGNRKRFLDARQNETVFHYDGLGRLVSVTDPAGTHETGYDGEGLKTRETDRRGVLRTYKYDTLGRLRLSEMEGRPDMSGVGWSEETRYLDRERKRIHVDARGTATEMQLDALDRVITSTDVNGDTVRTTWDGANKRAETDKRGNTTLFDYDGINRLVLTRDPSPFDGQTVQTLYEEALNKRTDVDRRGIARVTLTDPLGRVRSVARAGVTLETHTYDGLGNRLTSIDAEGKETHFDYDRANRLAARVDGFGTPEQNTTTFVPDRNGNVVEERDQRAADLGRPYSVHREFDAMNRVHFETDGEAHTTEYGYDQEGHRTLVVQPGQQRTEFRYDEMGALKRVIQPAPPGGESPVTRYDYDRNRNRLRQTDARDKVVEMEYDRLNRLHVMTQDPDGLALRTIHDYDPNGNETTLTDPKGQKVTSTFDELNRQSTRSFAFAPTDPDRPWRHTTGIAYTYDPNGNATRVEESVASGSDPPLTQVTERLYDDFDRPLFETVTLPEGGQRTVSYTYFLNGNRKTVTDPAALTTSYTYDGCNRLQTATTPAGATSYLYWPDGLLRSITFPSGVAAAYGYDDADRLTSLVNARGPDVLSGYSYGYDPNGNRLSQVETNGGTTESTGYTYDELDRLKTVRYPADATFPQGRLVTYGYDAVGNREDEETRVPGGAVLASRHGTFDAVNRLTTLADLLDPTQSLTFGYDRNGNQTRKQVGAATPTLFVYDVRDKLVEVDQGADVLGRFQYDFEGRRTKKIGEEGLRQYVYDQTSLLAEYDETGIQKAKYDYGSDRLISLTRPDEGRRFFSFDGLRSVVNLTDDTGSAVASYHLDAWGNFRFPSELLASKNRFSFTGYLWDQETSLFFAKARFYDPEVGRFTTQDSYLGQTDDPPSLHRYFYANANPVRYVDPTGHASEKKVYVCDSGGCRAESSSAPQSIHREHTSRAESEQDLPLDPATRKRFAQAQDRRRDGETHVSEGNPNGTGDPTLDGPATDALRQAEEQQLKQGHTMWRIAQGGAAAKEVSLTTLENLPGADAIQLAAGKNFHDEEINRASMGTAMVVSYFGTKVVVSVGGKVVKTIFKESEEAARAEARALRSTRTLAKEEEEAEARRIAGKGLEKPPTGRGSVPPAERDPKRVWTKGEKQDALETRGGKCDGCNETISIDEAKGHHIERHADGGTTTDDNLAILCPDCHKDIHKP